MNRADVLCKYLPDHAKRAREKNKPKITGLIGRTGIRHARHTGPFPYACAARCAHGQDWQTKIQRGPPAGTFTISIPSIGRIWVFAKTRCVAAGCTGFCSPAVDVGADIVVGSFGICSSAVEEGLGVVPLLQPETMTAIIAASRDNRKFFFTSNLPISGSRLTEQVDKQAATNYASPVFYTHYVVEEFKSL